MHRPSASHTGLSPHMEGNTINFFAIEAGAFQFAQHHVHSTWTNKGQFEPQYKTCTYRQILCQVLIGHSSRCTTIKAARLTLRTRLINLVTLVINCSCFYTSESVLRLTCLRQSFDLINNATDMRKKTATLLGMVSEQRQPSCRGGQPSRDTRGPVCVEATRLIVGTAT